MTELPVTSYGRKVIGEKSRLISLLMNFCFPGLGIIYAGKLKQGLIFFICSIVLVIIDLVLWIPLCGASLMIDAAAIESANFDPAAIDAASAGAMISVLVISLVYMVIGLVYLVFMILTMISGWNLCTENNTLWTRYLEEK
ncbi:MAG TPA: hypothetical protein O0X39_02980 [Methanocorpusculum sp.]|nr:hypothetical protein [Methanocorpusculum sp.]